MQSVRTAFMLLMSGVLILACSKDHHTGDGGNNGGGDTTLKAYSQAIIQMESLANEMEWLARQVIMNKTVYGDGSSFLNCAAVNRMDTPEGEMIRLTFNSACSDNSTRSGDLFVEFNSGTGDIMINADNYKVNGVVIEGSWSFGNVTGQPTIVQRLIVLNGQIKPAQGKSFRYSLDRHNSLREGAMTATADDDVFDNIEGDYSITLQDMGMAMAEVKGTLTRKHSCHAQSGWMPVSGKIEMLTNTNKRGTINFGGGGCDKDITIE